MGLCEKSGLHPPEKLAGLTKGLFSRLAFGVMQGFYFDSIDFEDTFATITLFGHQTKINDYEKLTLRYSLCDNTLW
jgi:hypothetical protein